MARAKAGARNITVEGIVYRWRVTLEDGPPVLTVWPAAMDGPVVCARFGDTPVQVLKSGQHRYLCGDQLVITNRLVRRVILLAISEHAYDPTRKGKPLTLSGIIDRIEMNDAVIANKRWL